MTAYLQPAFFEQPARPALNGHCAYRIEGDRVHLSVGEIANQRAQGDVSGTLSVELWALKRPYDGQSFEGVALAGTQIGEVLGQHYLSQCHYDLCFQSPPPGTWYVTLMLREWNGQAFETCDHVAFPLPHVVNWTPTLVVGQPAPEVAAPARVESTLKAKAPVTKAAPKTAEPVAKAAPKAAEPTTKAPQGKLAVPAQATKADVEAQAGIVSLNRASASEIGAIKGMSDKLARAIVAARPFRKLDDVLEVKGMGAKLLDKIRKHIAL